MNRGGISGIRDSLITGKVFSNSIPIGADTKLVSIMTRIFISGTIAARVLVGIKDSMASAPQELLVMASKPLGPLVVAFLLLNQLMGMLAMASINPEKPLLARKNRSSSSPPVASSQIAQPGRSGIILPTESRFPWLGHYPAPVKKPRLQYP